MRLTCTFPQIGLSFRDREFQVWVLEELPEVIPVVIEVKDEILAPRVVQEVAQRAQRQALGLPKPEPEVQAPPQPPLSLPPVDHVVDDEIPPPPPPHPS
ncbi:hypothetical protein Hanom_Chr10g00908381 [Helianthus anomalus]